MDILKIINGVVTHIIVWGDVFGQNNDDVILCILGCPGISLFYKEFGAELHIRTKLPVCIIGHAGHHVNLEERKKLQGTFKNSYDMKFQMDHKIKFINSHIKVTKKLHLIGHSLGAWLLIEMLDKNEDLLHKVESVNLLFPTLKELATTPMGKCINLLRKVHTLATLLLSIIELIPTSIRQSIIRLFLKINDLPYQYTEGVMLYINPEIAHNALKLAYEMIDTCTQLNNTAIEKIKCMTNVIFAVKDHWVPLSHIEELKSFTPQIQINEMNVDHAFVLKSSSKVAKRVSDFINRRCLTES